MVEHYFSRSSNDDKKSTEAGEMDVEGDENRRNPPYGGRRRQGILHDASWKRVNNEWMQLGGGSLGGAVKPFHLARGEVAP